MNIRFQEVIPGVTPQRLQEVERIISHTLPQEYKTFLLRYNGSRPKPAYFNIRWNGQEWAKGWEKDYVGFFLSATEESPSNFLRYQETFAGRIPNDTIVVAEDDGRNLILLGIGPHNYGQVFFWMGSYEVEEGDEADYSNVGFVANSFNEFIDSLYDGE